MTPLQEAIAKAVSTELGKSVGGFGDCVENITEAVLGVLRADDDTRYVAITKQHRDLLANLKSHARVQDVVAAYDAVAPNAKDHA